jgi:hypothetical protein
MIVGGGDVMFLAGGRRRRRPTPAPSSTRLQLLQARTEAQAKSVY